MCNYFGYVSLRAPLHISFSCTISFYRHANKCRGYWYTCHGDQFLREINSVWNISLGGFGPLNQNTPGNLCTDLVCLFVGVCFFGGFFCVGFCLFFLFLNNTKQTNKQTIKTHKEAKKKDGNVQKARKCPSIKCTFHFTFLVAQSTERADVCFWSRKSIYLIPDEPLHIYLNRIVRTRLLTVTNRKITGYSTKSWEIVSINEVN